VTLLLCLVWALLYLVLFLPYRALAAKPTQKALDAYTGGGMGPVGMLVEVPLGLVSYLAYGTLKRFGIPILESVQTIQQQGKGKATTWEDVLAKNMVDKPGGTILAVLMWGPRWNTHTNVLNLYATTKRSKSTFTIENKQQPGVSFQVVFYGTKLAGKDAGGAHKTASNAGQATLASVSLSPTAGDWVTVELEAEPGQIKLMLRTYIFDGHESAKLPRVQLDGQDVTDSDPGVWYKSGLDLNKAIRGQQSVLHLALQWHMFPMLCCRDLLPPALVRSTYLPVGNPETQWLYGPVLKGYSLHFEVAQSVLDEHLVFCTVYNRASLPVLYSLTVTSPSQVLPVCPEDGFWANRVVRKDGGTTSPSVHKQMKVTLVSN